MRLKTYYIPSIHLILTHKYSDYVQAIEHKQTGSSVGTTVIGGVGIEIPQTDITKEAVCSVIEGAEGIAWKDRQAYMVVVPKKSVKWAMGILYPRFSFQKDNPPPFLKDILELGLYDIQEDKEGRASLVPKKTETPESNLVDPRLTVNLTEQNKALITKHYENSSSKPFSFHSKEGFTQVL